MQKISNGYSSNDAVSVKFFSRKSSCIFFGLLFLFIIATLAVAAATLGIVVRRLSSNDEKTSEKNSEISFAQQIKIDELMKHLEQLQIIADRSMGTRAIATRGFNDTLDYIVEQLKQNTNLIIQHQYFKVQNYVVQGVPRFQSQVNGVVIEHTYLTDFTYVIFSSSANFNSFVQVVSVPNLGCEDSDWARVILTDLVALVKRGNCTFGEKSRFAEKYRVKGLLIYNDGSAADRFQPSQNMRNNLNTTIPVYFISYNLGIQLNDASTNATVHMRIDVTDADGIGNICADTPAGNKLKTIVVGSHSDGVPAGSGINDNGSGTIGNLVLALNLARLLQKSSSNYPPYQYRVRFCWWGAEEIGLLGSIYHVEQAAATNNNVEGERLRDYLLNLNYDMLAGPNYRFGIHDSSTAPPTTPRIALNGTKRITDLFRQWFTEQKLPWSNSSLGGGSDYVPFLAAGIAVGGVNTGAGGVKPATERDQYSAILGTGNGGLANAAYDPCYHQQCDRITNINPFAYEKVVKAAAHAIEQMGRMNDLERWLYPQGREAISVPFFRDRLYNIYNDPELL